MSGSFPKVCTTCGVEHDADTWASLERLQPQVMEPDPDDPDDPDGYVLELRNCQCKSTLAIKLPYGSHVR